MEDTIADSCLLDKTPDTKCCPCISVRPTLTHRVFCFPKELSLTRAYHSIIGVLVEWGLLLVFMVGVGKQVRDCLY